MAVKKGMRVLEIGCAEAGVLKAFTDKGCVATGVDLAPDKLEIAREMMRDELHDGHIEFFNKNIYEEEFKRKFRNQFDIVILKDVIEHIVEQEKLISYLHTFLKPDSGVIFFAFPPWYMPFGGHQQMCNSFLSRVPYFHILPMSLYRGLLKLFGEPQNKIDSLSDTKKTGITIERFERILKEEKYQILAKKHFLFNPIYKYKFNINPKEQYKIIRNIPYIRDFLTTAVYYLVKPS
jgi:2-polyprenyl-3-methyl-5-hydroxy-6-metoxy-1,4-benzoquinol methylase